MFNNNNMHNSMYAIFINFNLLCSENFLDVYNLNYSGQ